MLPRDPVFLVNLFRLKKIFSLPYPLGAKNSYLYAYARAGLYEGLKLLKVEKGENILVPDYICNAALSPLHSLGIQPRFYGLNRDLTPKAEELEKIIDQNTRALLVVNYFGFPNALSQAQEFCRRRGIFLIEDNAHGFLSASQGKPLGSYGDISIFSLRKTLPLPNAAALVVNNDKLKESAGLLKPYSKKGGRILRFLLKSFLETAGYYLKINPLPGPHPESTQTSADRREEFNLDKYLVACSNLSKFIIGHTDTALLAKQRREAYLEWRKFFQGYADFQVKILFYELPDGAAPYVFPLLVEEQQEFMLTMRKNGVECFPWPYLPEKSGERYFSRRLVCLPLTAPFEAAGLSRKMLKRKKLGWDDLKKRPFLKLYAGDIPEISAYEEFIGLSITRSDYRHILHDLTRPFPLADNSVDIFQAEDVLEHLAFPKLAGIIDEIHRVLKPGGLFRLSLPDYGCDLLYKRSVKNKEGRVIFDSAGGGTRKRPGHRWFPRFPQVKALLQESAFGKAGKIRYLHYYNDDGTYAAEKIDYSKGYIQRTPDHDQRVKQPYRPMSMVIDLIKVNNYA